MNKTITALLIFGLSACSYDPVITGATPFFDLKSFFQEEITKLQEFEQLTKTIHYNGKEEKQIISADGIDFEEELRVFTNSDINKAAWLEKYTVDSTFSTSGDLLNLEYTALDPELRTRNLQIEFEDDQPKRVKIHNKSGSYLSNSEQQLFYESEEGYRIDNVQELMLFTDQALQVDVVFQK